ncbi:MAG TPA: PAS domain-containing sensor histidine kinase [Magnetospirillum sp.]|jgi:PAS domain S-box-containing protein|nr:PAS domain-containing sensor histidine kinase [Magnetospirillum sp.]
MGKVNLPAEAANATLTAVLDNAPVSIALVDQNRRYVFGNKFFCETYGISPNAIVGMSSQLIFRSQADWAEVGQEAYPVIRAGGTYDREYTLRRSDDSSYPARVIGRLVEPTDPALGTIWVVEDLSDRKAAQEKQAAEMANVAKSRFLAAASHDLRQPFQAMMLYKAVLEGRLTDAQDIKVLKALDDAMQAGQELLNALLHVSTLEAGITQPSIGSIVLDDVLAPLAAEYGEVASRSGVGLRYLPSHAVVNTDPVLLGRMVRNLLSNAVRYTGNGHILVGVRRAGPRKVRIEVWDTGTGIPADRLEDIWEEFIQLDNPERDRTKGLGLGLAIVARTANLLGHTVGTRSRLGVGSVFSIALERA